MKFAVVKNGTDPVRDRVADAIVQELERQGHTADDPENGIQFVLNLTDLKSPKPFHRRSQAVFVVSLAVLKESAPDMRSLTYTALVRSYSNMMLSIASPNGGNGSASAGDSDIYFTTPEVGFYHHTFDPVRTCRNMMPIVGSRMMIRNRLSKDLPPRFWAGSDKVEMLKRYGSELDRLGVLPSPFPLDQVLDPEGIEHIYRIFEIKGLSYGNLSVREPVEELSPDAFWMTARGVNKARLSAVGFDILLVKGIDEAAGEILVSMPPEHSCKARVSVDAIEHFLIYRRFPETGAIVHVHAWMDGVPSTRQNYPCGTRDLAEEAVRRLGEQPAPERAVIGLKNHGLTVTGPTLEDIFGRIRGRLQTTVPMFG
jgi:ribulose-5-phosphate 4-epimerase/fuculose-1-phosphate aldolase